MQEYKKKEHDATIFLNKLSTIFEIVLAFAKRPCHIDESVYLVRLVRFLKRNYIPLMEQKAFTSSLTASKKDSIDKNIKNLPKNRRKTSLRGGTTKQSRHEVLENSRLDCFAALAMTQSGSPPTGQLIDGKMFLLFLSVPTSK